MLQKDSHPKIVNLFPIHVVPIFKNVFFFFLRSGINIKWHGILGTEDIGACRRA